MERAEERTPFDDPAQIARHEESLVALYMELTGASANQARSVYAFVEAEDRPGWDQDFPLTDLNNSSTPPQKTSSEPGNRLGLKGRFSGGGAMFEPGTASVPSAAGGGW